MWPYKGHVNKGVSRMKHFYWAQSIYLHALQVYWMEFVKFQLKCVPCDFSWLLGLINLQWNLTQHWCDVLNTSRYLLHSHCIDQKRFTSQSQACQPSKKRSRGTDSLNKHSIKNKNLPTWPFLLESSCPNLWPCGVWNFQNRQIFPDDVVLALPW